MTLISMQIKNFIFVVKLMMQTDNEVAFVAKFSELGVKEWEKTLESQSGENYTEFIRMDVSGNAIY